MNDLDGDDPFFFFFILRLQPLFLLSHCNNETSLFSSVLQCTFVACSPLSSLICIYPICFLHDNMHVVALMSYISCHVNLKHLLVYCRVLSQFVCTISSSDWISFRLFLFTIFSSLPSLPFVCTYSEYRLINKYNFHASFYLGSEFPNPPISTFESRCMYGYVYTPTRPNSSHKSAHPPTPRYSPISQPPVRDQ